MTLAIEHGLQIERVFTVFHENAPGSPHYILVLRGGSYICDCMMGINLGIPCRHYWALWATNAELTFHIGLIRPRCALFLLFVSS